MISTLVMKRADKIRSVDAMAVPVVVVLGKVAAFASNALLGAYYGVGMISDAFLMAHAIPTILFEGVATAIVTCYIPIYSELQVESPNRIDEYDSNMTSISFLLSVLITALFLLFHRQINAVYASGFSQEALALLDHYSVIIIWCIPFMGAYSIFRAYLQVSGRRAMSIMGQCINNAVLIAAIIAFFPRADSLPWATLAASVCAFCIFFVSAASRGYRYHFCLSFRSKYVKAMFVMIVPNILSTLAGEINTMVDKSFASKFAEGIVTSLTYGSQMSFTIQTIASSSLVTIIYPLLSHRAAKNDHEGVNLVVCRSVELMCWVVAPLVAGGALLAQPIVRFLFGHGNLTGENVVTIAHIFVGYLVGALPMCINHLGGRVVLAWKKSNYALIISLMTSGTNVVLDFIMSRILGYMGLVFATGLSIICGTVTSLLLMKKNDPTFSVRSVIAGIVRPLAVTAVMAVAVYALIRILDDTAFFWLWKMLICIVAGGAVYGAVCLSFFRKRLGELLMFFKQVV